MLRNYLFFYHGRVSTCHSLKLVRLLSAEPLASRMPMALGEMCLLKGYFYRHSALLDNLQ